MSHILQMISNGFKINNGSVSEQTENMKHFHINSPTSATTSVLFHLPTQTIVPPPGLQSSPGTRLDLKQVFS